MLGFSVLTGLSDPMVRFMDQVDGHECPTETAVRWVARLSLGEPSAADVTELKEWLARDSAHQDAFNRARRLYAGLAPLEREVLPARPARRLQPRHIVAALMAAAASVVLVVMMPRLVPHDFTSPIGQVKHEFLVDGSDLWLDSGSAVDFRMDGKERVLTVARGRVHVSVAPNREQLFSVRTADAIIHDIGTAFTVDEAHDHLQVDVRQGAVEVAFDSQTTLVEAGRSVRFVAGTSPVAHDFDERVESDWRNGHVTLNGMDLAGTLRTVQRYRRGAVLLLDSELGDVPISGSLSLQDIEGSLDALAAGSGLRLRRLPFLLIVTAESSDKK